jgi:hypothetical protein
LEEFIEEEEIKPTERPLANEFRLWLGVTWISKLADINGREIPIEHIRNGSDWRAMPVEGYNWPNTVKPNDRHRAAFRKCLQLTFCPDGDPYTRSKNYPLRQPLGTWYPVARMIQFPAYRSKDSIYYRDELGLHRCQDTRKGFYDIPLECVTAPPLNSHPINPNLSGRTTFWTQRPRILIRQFKPKHLKFVTGDNLPYGPIEKLDLVSDASVHLEQEKGAITWHAVTEDDRRLSMDIPIEVPRHSYSYRHELVGIYEGLSEL